jgi:hypothetical protein
MTHFGLPMVNKVRKKKSVSDNWENNNTTQLQQPQPISVVVNKYIMLDSLPQNLRYYITIVGPEKQHY